MPSINKSLLDLLTEPYQNYSVFIETGTFLGDTIFSVEPLFEKLYTIEISKELYENAKKRSTSQKIEFIHGDSSNVLAEILPTIKKPAILFLDGHWSSGITGKGEKDCPLNEEVSLINSMFNERAILIIDDFRLFGMDSSSGIILEDWSSINKDTILSILSDRISQVYHLPSELSETDRLIIHIKPIEILPN